MTYAFILGKNTALSVAEIVSVLKRESFVFVVLSITQKALVIKLDKKIEDPQNFLDGLGGTVKIVHIFTTQKEDEIIGPILEFATNGFKEQKFIFGISSYGASNPRLGFEIKKELKKAGINSRFVQGKEKALSAPEIRNNKMISHGADFVIIKDRSDIFIGDTLAIQDYESYSYRDYERPRRNAKSGMLPPKVAQVMINLVPQVNVKIYDPFCGQGTVLQEASLMGVQSIGSDISKSRVHDTKENLSWLKKEYNLDITEDKMVFQSDALAIKDIPSGVDPEAIVSEVYLGPPLTNRVSDSEMEDILEELGEEYSHFLENTRKGGLNIKHLVLALPFYKTKSGDRYLNIIDEAQKMGYNVISPIENAGIDFSFFPEYKSGRKTMIYSRPEQIVGREILVLEKT